ncbi:unnamed protein product [Paramecium octaurelia]|uniref:Uncharacterized protein n=1 Tax=Paramecium octaurelia TaxID=43137 RepID=A0A8S1TBK9_PAROT|nr:unnamed protein product [Paramecium octaurelia]
MKQEKFLLINCIFTQQQLIKALNYQLYISKAQWIFNPKVVVIEEYRHLYKAQSRNWHPKNPISIQKLFFKCRTEERSQLFEGQNIFNQWKASQWLDSYGHQLKNNIK